MSLSAIERGTFQIARNISQIKFKINITQPNIIKHRKQTNNNNNNNNKIRIYNFEDYETNTNDKELIENEKENKNENKNENEKVIIYKNHSMIINKLYDY